MGVKTSKLSPDNFVSNIPESKMQIVESFDRAAMKEVSKVDLLQEVFDDKKCKESFLGFVLDNEENNLLFLQVLRSFPSINVSHYVQIL